jgi:hypothetical protein
MTNFLRKYSAVALGLILTFLLGGCGGSRLAYVGTYRSVEPFAGKDHVTLVLKQGGECTWTLGEEGNTLEFKWRISDGRIWVYTKEGGIIIITPSEGGKVLSADMSGEWHPRCPPDKCLAFTRINERRGS